MKSVLRVVPPVMACFTLAGCALALPAPIVIEGRAFAEDKLTELAAGMPGNDVEALLGPPLRRARRDGADVWTYEFARQRKECRMVLFGVIPLEPIGTDRHQLEVTFRNREVVHAVQRQHTSRGRSAKVIVGQ